MRSTKTIDQLLVPVSVPWMISPSVPYLKIEHPPGCPMAAYFIAYFKCEEKASPEKTSSLSLIRDPGRFVPDDNSAGATYRLVRVEFSEPYVTRQMPAFADHEVLREEDYDWSLVPSNLLAGESISEYQLRIASTWRRDGLAPDPMMYEVRNSRWISDIGAQQKNLHHFILAGHDNYIEVLAKDWHWQAGQPVQ